MTGATLTAAGGSSCAGGGLGSGGRSGGGRRQVTSSQTSSGRRVPRQLFAAMSSYSVCSRSVSSASITARTPDLLGRLSDANREAIGEIQLLASHYAGHSVPSSWLEWDSLPETGPDIYERTLDIREASRNIANIYAPAAPTKVSLRAFPLPIVQSYSDKIMLERLYCPRVHGQWFDGIRFYAAASSPRRSRRTWAGLR